MTQPFCFGLELNVKLCQLEILCQLRVAATSLLTRKVRLPIPSMAQLDAARSFGSAFEQQKIGDQFRVRSLGWFVQSR